MEIKNNLNKNNSDLNYYLDVRIPDQLPKKMMITGQLQAGIDPRNDLILIDSDVEAKHFLFKNKDNILTVTLLAHEGQSFLNGRLLETGKAYMIDFGDIIGVGEVRIYIQPNNKINPLENIKTKSTIFNIEPLAELQVEMPIKAINKQTNKSNPKVIPSSNISAFKLIPFKIYGFIVDVAITYFVLSFVIPSLKLLSTIQDFLFPFTEILSSFKMLSLIEFFICFHILMISSSLILGTTPGAFLIGLHHKGKNHFLAIRFKAYIYALLNLIFLPLVIFDIPFYKAKNLKEFLTFSERELSNSVFFKMLRRSIVPLLLIACFFSPFFQKLPYSACLTFEKNFIPKYVDTHTFHYSSSSNDLGISLESDINDQYAIFPYLLENKMGLMFYDKKNNQSLIMLEKKRLAFNQLLLKLRYANPLASLKIPSNHISNIELKKISLKSLGLTLENFFSGLLEFGPMLANNFLFKEQFLGSFKVLDNINLNAYELKNPVIKISSESSATREQKVYLFTNKDLIEFDLLVPKDATILDQFSRKFLANLQFKQGQNKTLNDPQILEVIEAFEASNYSIILTYYINEAMRMNKLNNIQMRDLFIQNVLQTKRALLVDKLRLGMNKNIEKSFDDIINSIK